MKRSRGLWLIVVVTLLAVAFYLWGYSHTPTGQPQLVSLNPRNITNFQETFDAAAADTRVVLLLSPT